MIRPEIERLIQLLSKLPGLGPRSARRAALHLMKRRDSLLVPLSEAMAAAGESIRACSICGNLDSRDPCTVCSDPTRDRSVICVVEDAGEPARGAAERVDVGEQVHDHVQAEQARQHDEVRAEVRDEDHPVEGGDHGAPPEAACGFASRLGL